jgi:NAD(P)-dependent dehydrogenase (short-subunit alcohol dehydrogenase family)
MLPLLRRSSAGRIVNLSSNLGSLTLTNNPNWTFTRINLLAHNSSKTALNTITVQIAKELHDTPIKVNSADPGYTGHRPHYHTGTRSVEQGRIGRGAPGDATGRWAKRWILRRRCPTTVVRQEAPYAMRSSVGERKGRTHLPGHRGGDVDHVEESQPSVEARPSVHRGAMRPPSPPCDASPAGDKRAWGVRLHQPPYAR